MHVALVTGRSYPFARPVAEGLPDSLTLIVSNGAVERGMDGATRARRLLDKNVARTVLDANAGHRAATALVFDRDVHGQIVFETMDWIASRAARATGRATRRSSRAACRSRTRSSRIRSR